MMGRSNATLSPFHALSFCLVAFVCGGVLASSAQAGIEDIEWKGAHFAFEAGLGPGHLSHGTTDSRPSISEPGLALNFGLGLAVHRRFVIHVRLESVTTAVQTGSISNTASTTFGGIALRWWAHDWATLEIGLGGWEYTWDRENWKEPRTQDEGNAFLFSVGVPLAHSGRHHHQLHLSTVLAGFGDGDLRMTTAGYRWQWR